MSMIKRVLIAAIIILAVLGAAGCLGLTSKEKAQDKYDRCVIDANSQIAITENVSLRQNLPMDEPAMKAWLAEFRSQILALEGNVTAAIDAGAEFRGYLSSGGAEDVAVANNEQNLRLNLDLYKRDYNNNANGYNSHWGAGNGTVPLFAL
jgi:hypothetical protein